MELILDILQDSLLDTAKLVPFLFVTYLAMEAIEHGASQAVERAVAGAGAFGPVVGAVLGVVPQCGFSAMAATLYSGRIITVGTLLAVFLSTSDEMLPVFVAGQMPFARMLPILGIKAVCGIVAGVVADLVVRATGHAPDGHLHIHELCERAGCECDDIEDDAHDDHDHGHDHGHGHGHGHGHDHGGTGMVWGVVRSALVHTVQVTLFIFAVSLVLGGAVELVGQDAIGAFMGRHPLRAVFLSGLVGLIPNCGASVAISQLFLEGSLGTPAMLSGLLVSGGTGLLVLFRTNDHQRQNLIIVAALYAVGVAVGVAAAILGVSL